MACFSPAARAATASLALLLGGCVNLGGAKPPAQLFTLQAASPAPAGYVASARPADALLVLEPEVDKALAEKEKELMAV